MNRNKKNVKNILKIILPFIIGALLGFIIVLVSGRFSGTEASAVSTPFIIFVSVVLGFILHIVLHEAGHLIAGLLSGYKFVSFSVGSLMIIKQNGKMKFKRFAIAGAGGQCLMSPPEPIGYAYPFTFYYLGGGLANLLTSGVFIAHYLLINDIFIYAGNIFIPIVALGILTCLMNLLPLKISGLATDGHNVVSLIKNKRARQAHWILLTINARIASGGKAKDLPEEWFDFSGDYDFSNAILANIATMGLARLIDIHDFCAAKKLAEKILEKGGKLIELLKNETRCELLFLVIIHQPSQGRADEIERLFTPELEKYIKASKTQLSKHRLMYAYNKLVLYDIDKSEKALAAFNKICLTYPYTGDRESEKELIGIIDSLAT